MPSGTDPSGYVLVPLREGADFILYRGKQHDNPSPVLVVALAPEQPSPQSLRRLEHEYSLAAGVDPGWGAKPLAHRKGRTTLVLKDPGGEPPFSGNDLKEVLRSEGIKLLVMAGVVTSGVILSTFTLAAGDYSMTILSDACADPKASLLEDLMTNLFPRSATVV